MRQLLKAAVVVLTIVYPFAIYLGLQYYSATTLLPLLMLLLILRWFAGNRPGERLVLIAILSALVIVGLAYGHQLGLKFYPALVNLGFLVLFAGSLWSPQSFVERLARLRNPELPQRAVVYTRRVTWLWSCFFVVNGSIAAFTALYASDAAWALYNGFIAYLLIAALAGGEWLVRRRVMR